MTAYSPDNPFAPKYSPDNPLTNLAPAPQQPTTNPLTDLGNLALRGYAATAQGVNWLIGSESGQDYWRGVSQDATQALSPEQQAASQKEFVHQKDPNAPWYDLSNYEAGPALRDWRSYTGAIAESAPGTMMSMGVGGPLTKGLTAVGGRLLPLAEKGMNRLAMGAGAVGYGSGEGLVAGTTDATQARDEVLNRPVEQLAQTSGLYRQQIASGLPPDAARKAVADAVANQVGWESGLTVGLTGAPMGALMGKWFHGGGLGSSRTAGILQGMAGEAGQETLQSGAERYIQNLAERDYVDPNRPLGEGVANAAIAGGISGGLMGGGIASVAPGRRASSPVAGPATETTAPQAEPEPAPTEPTVPQADSTTPPSPTAIDPTAGPISRAAVQSPSAAQLTEAADGQQQINEATQNPDPGRPEPAIRKEIGSQPDGQSVLSEGASAQPGPETVAASGQPIQLQRGQSIELSPQRGQQTARPTVSAEEQARLAEKMGARPQRNPRADSVAPSPSEAASQPQPEISHDPLSEKGQAQAAPLLDVTHQLANLRTEEIPLDRLRLSEDVPQFKSGANAAGVVEPLGGKYERTGTAPIVVWERADGRQEVISGRHRLDLARRSGEQSIPAQVLREADGFTADKAAMLDAELNIRDNQGKVKDYVQYFQGNRITQGEAESRGLLARETGKRAYTIAHGGTESLLAVHRADQLSDDAAYRISRAAPGNERLQVVGIKAVQDGKSATHAVNLMQAVGSLAAARGVSSDSTTDLFGFDDSAIKEAEQMATLAGREQRRLSERLAAIQGAAKRPELARQEGVNVNDPGALRTRIAEVRQARDAWEHWSSNPDLVAQIRAQMPFSPKDVRHSRNSLLSSDAKPAGMPVERVQARAQLVDALGERRVRALEQSGRLRMHETDPTKTGAAGFVDPQGVIHLIPANMDQDALSVALHEALHVAKDERFLEGDRARIRLAHAALRLFGLKNFIGGPSFSDLTQQVQRLAAQGNRTAQEAIAKAQLEDPQHVAEESLAYLAQYADIKAPIVQRVLAAIRAALYRMGLKVQLTPADVRALALSALKAQASAAATQDSRRANGRLQTAYSMNEFAPTAEDQAEVARQMAAVKEVRDDQGRLLAPNGRPSKLTEWQWKATRTAFFKTWFGDWETDPANASQVLDENGEPLAVYHGTNATKTVAGRYREGDPSAVTQLQEIAKQHGIPEDRWDDAPSILERWHEFGLRDMEGYRQGERYHATAQTVDTARRLQELAKGTAEASQERLGFNIFRMPGKTKELGSHFGTQGQAMARGVPFQFFLKMDNPLRMPDLGTWDFKDVIAEAKKRGVEITAEDEAALAKATNKNDTARHLLLAKGVDGIVYRNDAEGAGDSYIAIAQNQIKSATDNTGTFSSRSPRIDYSQPTRESDAAEQERLWEEFQRVRAQFQTQHANTTAFQRWFGQGVEGVTAKDGKPLTLYHGTPTEFYRFDASRSGKNSQHPTSGLGFFMTADRGAAARYGANVLELHAKINAPYYLTDADLMAADSVEAATKLKQRLQEKGYDGAVVTGPGMAPYVIAFESKQVKLTSNQNPTESADFRYSRRSHVSDQDYLEAVERGDIETARQMVLDAAAAAGYIASNYRMAHEAPNSDGGYNLATIKESGVVPMDYWEQPNLYQTTPDELHALTRVAAALHGRESRIAQGKSGNTSGITVYRAVPKFVKEDRIRNGDWVTPSEAYAKREGEEIPGGYRLISQSVLLKDLWWDGNSITELGYDDGKEVAYKNTKNNKKLLAPVTRDDSGNVIPLSKRFNERIADIRYSRPGRPDAWNKDLPQAVKDMAAKIGADPKPLTERVSEMKGTLATRLRQGLVDRFARLADLDRQRFGTDFMDTNTALSAWVAAKMSKSPEGALEAAFLHGELVWDEGALNVKDTNKGLVKALEPVAQAGEMNRFWQWIIANRAERLASEGREHLFTPAEIQAGKQLNQGQMADGKSRAAIYQQTFNRYRGIQKSILDIAQQAGLFNAAQRAQWEHDFYLPFYRVIEDEGEVRGPTAGGKLVRQKAFEKLKGGTEKLGDPLQNVLKNWFHLIDASLKNRAASLALDTAANLGVAQHVNEAMADKSSVWAMKDGQKVHYNVADPLTLEAISALHTPMLSGWAMKALAATKRALTLGTTISPAFKARNLLRDSIAALAVSKLSPNAFGNVARGFKAAKEGSATQAALIAGGGTFRFGTLLEGDRDAAAKRIAGFKPDTVLDSKEKIQGVFDLMKHGLEKWNQFGDRLETANRAALYEQMRKENKTHLQASLAARDLMDFAQSGGWGATRFLITAVPFLNARIQGLDVLYRKGFKPLGKAMAGQASQAEKQQAARFAMTTFMVSAASVALYLMFKDDKDFKEREQWDRDTYWWFKIPGTEQPFRIPKPFEIGALGTLAERLAEQLCDPEAGGALFAERMGAMLSQTFAFDPTPQLFKPMLEIAANKNSFTQRPIETLDMERLSPEQRKRYNTSALATGLSQAGLGKMGLSPVQVEHLIRGYFGWIGAQALLLGDMAARPALGLPEKPQKLKDAPIFGDLLNTFAPDGRGSRYVTEFYSQLQQIRQLHADAKLMQKLGDTGLSGFVQDHRKELALAAPMEQAARTMAEFGKMERRIAEDRTLSGQEKQVKIDLISERKQQMAKRLRTALAH